MFKSFTVARIGGIAIEIHPSWLLILALLAWSLSEGVFPELYERWSAVAYWTIGGVSALLLFVTVLIHELAHAIVARRRGLPVDRITLFIFGGVSHLGRQPKTAGEEFAIAAAGPATSIVIAIVCGGLALLFSTINEKPEAIFSYLATVNLILAIFNLLPGFPLDGGRVLRSIAWRRTGSFREATAIAGSVGQFFGYLLMGGGVVLMLGGNPINGLWFMFIGWFLLNAARSESESMQLEKILSGLTARDVMREEWATVSPGAPIQAVVDDQMLGEGARAVVVARDGAVAGILTVSDVRRIPRDQWASTPAQSIMTPRERVVAVDAFVPALQVLSLIAEHSLNQVPVLDAGRMVGMITRRELLERVQLAESLAPPE